MSRYHDEHCCPKKVCHIHHCAPRGNNNSILIVVALLFLLNNNNNGSGNGNVNRNIIRINDGDIETF